MIQKPEQYYDTRRHQLYYQWRESEYFSHQEPIYDRTRKYIESLEAEHAKLLELATYALKHIIEFECEVPDREMLRGKPCEDCADYGSSDCPKCMPRMFDVSGIEVDE